jgi:hypothetical protein
MIAEPRRATLVVIEYGASWPRWLEPGRSGDMAVVAQHYEGEPTSLVTQVASRVTRLEAGGWELDSIVFVTSNRTDKHAASARSVLARGLLARLEAAGQGTLVLTTGARANERGVQALRNLAFALDGSRAARNPAIVLAARNAIGEPLYDGLPSSSRILRAG